MIELELYVMTAGTTKKESYYKREHNRLIKL